MAVATVENYELRRVDLRPEIASFDRSQCSCTLLRQSRFQLTLECLFRGHCLSEYLIGLKEFQHSNVDHFDVDIDVRLAGAAWHG